MESYWHKFGKMWQKMPRRAKGIQKLFDDFAAVEEISLHCKNTGIFHQFCGIMGSIFSDVGKVWVTNLNKTGTSPSKTWLS